MKASSVGICSRSEGTSGLSRVKCTLSKVMWITCWMPFPSWHEASVVLVVLEVVVDVVVVLEVVVVGIVVVVVDVVLEVVVVLLGVSTLVTESTQLSMTALRVAAVLA